ncbi:gastrin-releasing peptide [Festucalex cinctus]
MDRRRAGILWLALILLVFHCCHCPAAPLGKMKMNPRGRHWAVGHLMGKKSAERQLIFFERTKDPFEDTIEALIRNECQKVIIRSSNQQNYTREIADLHLLAIEVHEQGLHLISEIF